MKILVDAKKVNGTFNYKGRIRLRFKIGELLNILTESSVFSDGSYAFLEKHCVDLVKLVDNSYVELSVLAQNGILLAQITVFYKKFKELQTIEIKTDNEIYRVHYSLHEIADGNEVMLLRKTTMIHDNQANSPLTEQTGKLQILRLGVLVYNFAQRLDPLIYLYHLTLDLLMWKNAYKTIGMGILLTLVIYNLKMAIFLAGLILYLCRQFLFRRLQKLHKYKNYHRRVIVPEENGYFIQHGMDNYCLLYDNACEFLFNDDKTLLINIINLLCKMGTFLIALLFLFGVEHLLVIFLWSSLILTSPYKGVIKQYIKPTLEFVVGQYSRIVDRITSGISNVLGSSIKIEDNQIERQFYFYKYQRWWVLKGWTDQVRKYSDQDYQCFVVPKDIPPEGWVWTEEWKIDYSGDVDSDGFQYSNDINSHFAANKTIAFRRRRKWKRSCSRPLGTEI